MFTFILIGLGLVAFGFVGIPALIGFFKGFKSHVKSDNSSAYEAGKNFAGAVGKGLSVAGKTTVKAAKFVAMGAVMGGAAVASKGADAISAIHQHFTDPSREKLITKAKRLSGVCAKGVINGLSAVGAGISSGAGAVGRGFKNAGEGIWNVGGAIKGKASGAWDSIKERFHGAE